MATESDWDIVKTEVSDDGYLPQHPLCTALARLEAEHNRLQETVKACAEKLQVSEEDLLAGVALVVADLESERKSTQRLRADSERLRAALLKSCSLCHGSGTYHPECGFCMDSTHDHECPAPLPCTHPYLTDFVRAP